MSCSQHLETNLVQYILPLSNQCVSSTCVDADVVHSLIASFFPSLSLPFLILSFLSLTNRDSEEMFSDSEYMTSPPPSKLFPCPAVDTSSQKLYHDEAELLSDNANTKPLSKEVEAVVESPIRKISIQELEASVDGSCRKMAKEKVLGTSFEIPSLKRSKEESYIEATSRKISRDKGEVPMNVAVKKGLSNELDADFPARKVERDTIGDFMDTASRNVYRERSDLPLDVRKMLWNELEATTDVAPRKISADMMGISMDSAMRKIIRDDAERPFDSVSRRIKRDSVGMSLDTSYRKLPRNKGEYQLDSSVRALAMDKMVETTKIPPRKTSRDELEYFTDTASITMLPREKFEALMDTYSSTDKQEFGFEPSTSRRILGEELEMSAGSLRRRTPRMPRDDSDSSTDSPTGKIPWDRDNVPLGVPKRSLLREDSGASESSSSPGRTEKPDLMVTSQGPWKSSSDLFPAGPLSQLVYDGILEKSCNSMATAPTNLSASTPNLPQSKLLAEVETPLSPPRITFPSPEVPCAGQKDKEKSKKSLKLKNLFKKKNESSQEKLQSGLQKL